MKILIVSDAWHPQTNGVVRTLQFTSRELETMGHSVRVIGPRTESWSCFAMPGYPEINLELFAHLRLLREMRDFLPDCVHIATEGPLGWAARTVCRLTRRPFTTAYHTQFPEYMASRMPGLLKRPAQALAYLVLRQFHSVSKAVLVATETMDRRLAQWGVSKTVRWSRGVDTDLFRPCVEPFSVYEGLPRPLLLYVGRVSVEKNLPAFLDLKTAGTKIVVGEGPDKKALQAAYPEAVFPGKLEGETLARAFAAADLFVFPSKTDTFGLVLLEACAAGLRIAAYPVPGPIDVLSGQEATAFAVLDEDLQKAVDRALTLPPNPHASRAFAMKHSWRASAEQFFSHMAHFKG